MSRGMEAVTSTPRGAARTPTPQQVAAAFLRPRPPLAPRESAHAQAAAAHVLELPNGRLNYWRLGEEPAVLLIHGWEGAPADMDAFAEPLRVAGLGVVWVELPAHGKSDLPWTSVLHAADAIGRLGDALGPLRGVVAHSVGGAVATRAIHNGLAVERVVLIGTPARYDDYARGFARAAGLDDAGTGVMLRQLAQHYGADVTRVSTPDAAARLRQPALVVHSRDDKVVSLRDAESIAAAWVGAKLLRCDGLGHRRILADAGVVQAATAFIVDPHDSTATG